MKAAVTAAKILEVIRNRPKQKWWTPTLVTNHIFGPLCLPQHQSAVTTRME